MVEKQENHYQLEVRKEGLGIATAAVFLAGEMAGTGVLALPSAMIVSQSVSQSVSQ